MSSVYSRQHVLLNFDDSAGKPENALNIDLAEWQEMIRFGCQWSEFRQLQNYLAGHLPQSSQLGCVCMGSGDYHHVTQLLLETRAATQPIHLIVCDNHPDNMRYPLGIHCGSWVYWASRLEQVARIDVIGISSGDIGLAHAWENHWSPLRQGKLHYWSVQQNAAWTRVIGARNAWHGCDHADELLTAFRAEIAGMDAPVYLSIDKDVLSRDVVVTNWDQGHLLESHLQDLIQACRGRLIAADITGDVSAYQYKNWLKRFLTGLDGQQEPSQREIECWQKDQQQLNLRLMAAMDSAWL
ncbi:hypothetical protein [Acinetobacter sp. WZC-1]|uniref:hypothetical protein n=1 Tax=Acinetobacter sp. WZC-1 TaxID=3459034 RepID=UPI00403E083E